MNRLHISGDLHGDAIGRFSYRKHPELRENDSTDIILILGDCGLPFGVLASFYKSDLYKNDRYQLEWLSKRPEQFVFLCGNHDDRSFISNLPHIQKYENTVRQMVFDGKTYDNIVYIDTPGIYNFNGCKCLAIPGASSHDIQDGILDPQDPDFKQKLKAYTKSRKLFRIKNWTWWEDEAINVKQCEVIRVEQHWDEQMFDYIFTHDTPGSLNDCYGFPYRIQSTEGQNYLEELANALNYKEWYHGHMHIDYLTNPYHPNITCLYDSIKELTN